VSSGNPPTPRRRRNWIAAGWAVCIEPPQYVIGLRHFEQYIYRHQPDGVRSGPGDLDLTVYSLRKWMRLAVSGNPTVLLPLFAPDQHVLVRSQLGEELRQSSSLAEDPDRDRVDAWMVAAYQRAWATPRRPTGQPA
jgi:predicted nucleotidyltransferase